MLLRNSKTIPCFLVFATLLGLAAHSQAAAILYWEADGNATNTGTGTSLDGSLNSYGTGGTAPTYSSSVPGAIITAGVGGSVVNGSNTNSFSFVNSGLPGASDSQAGGVVSVTSPTFQITTFTVEAFVKTSSLAGFSTILNLSNSIGLSWMLDTEGTTGKLRIRADTGGVGGSTNKTKSGLGTDPNNKSILDDAWHHVAVTSNGTSFTVYLDYVAVITDFNPDGDILYNGTSVLRVGAGPGSARAYNGLVDEVRFSNEILTTDQFLRAIPEPTSALLGVMGLLGFMRRKRD